MSLFPKSPKFFDIFTQLAKIVDQAGSIIPKIKNGAKKDTEKYAKEARRLELEANKIRHKLAIEAEKTFITPIDREDIHVLARRLDNIVDYIEDLVSNLMVYQIKKDTGEFKSLGEKIHETTKNVYSLIEYLRYQNRNIDEMKKLILKIHTLENEGDELNKKAVISLFKQNRNIIEIIKWKDLFQDAENILNECENTADIVDEIIIKNF